MSLEEAKAQFSKSLIEYQVNAEYLETCKSSAKISELSFSLSQSDLQISTGKNDKI